MADWQVPALCCGVVVGGRVARRVGGVVTVGDVRIVHRACLQTTMKEIKKANRMCCMHFCFEWRNCIHGSTMKTVEKI